ncbi:hypothetical protein NA78x_002666 [Anatilimnocola sp. NA78]|uniref:hypothetical protein n=1 Tax=Anatilimnocola sp. NA78 TaxID=3415683 RepID=UPI003CE56157
MFVIPESFSWSHPWIKIPDDYISFPSDHLTTVGTPHQILNAELHREMPEGHTLYARATEVVAVCTVTHKDFVFVTDDASKPIAIVHLTWSLETNPIWPRTQIIASLEHLKLEIRKWADKDFWGWPGKSRLIQDR